MDTITSEFTNFESTIFTGLLPPFQFPEFPPRHEQQEARIFYFLVRSNLPRLFNFYLLVQARLEDMSTTLGKPRRVRESVAHIATQPWSYA